MAAIVAYKGILNEFHLDQYIETELYITTIMHVEQTNICLGI